MPVSESSGPATPLGGLAGGLCQLERALRGLAGWRPSAAATIAGAASVLAMAPFFLWGVLFITFPVLVWLIDVSVERAAATPSRPATRPAVQRAMPAG